MADTGSLQHCTECGRLYNSFVNPSCPACTPLEDKLARTQRGGTA